MMYELAIGVSGGLDSTVAYFYALHEEKLREKDI
jgi:tRNA(Ile)-lysidine synthase TilS/MesJ